MSAITSMRRFDESLAQRMWLADVGDGKRPADAVKVVGAALLILGAPEIRQHVGKAPAGIAELPPVIVVLVLAADVEQVVDRTRSAQHFAARLNDLPIVQFGFGLGFVQPVDLGIVEQFAVAKRNVNPDMAVMAAGFEQEHAMATGLGEAVREHAAGRS